MKRIVFLLFLSACFTSCTVLLDSYDLYVVETDFSKYSEQGIFVTTGDSPEMYESIALLRAYCFEGYTVTEKIDDGKYLDDTYRQRKTNTFKKCNENEIIDELVQDAIDRGANGIIKLEIEYVTVPRTSNSSRSFIVVSGLAVRF